MGISRTILSLGFTLLVLSIKAADTDINVAFENHISKLNEESVLSVYRDSKGFLWVGTYSGLYRSDGTDVRFYTSNPNNIHSLSSPSVYSIYEDRDSNLWIGNQRGLDRYDYNKDYFVHYIPSDPSNNWEYIEIRDIGEDNSGNLWLATYNHFGLIKYNPVTRLRTTFWLPDYDEQRINTLEVDDSILWIGAEFKGLYKLNLKTDSITNIVDNADNNPLTINDIKIIDHELWIGTWNNGLVNYKPGENKITWLHKNQPCSKDFTGLNIRQIAVDRDKNLWLAVYGDGVNFFSPKTNQVRVLKSKSNTGSSSNRFLSWCIFADNQDILWIGSMETGLRKVFINDARHDLLQYRLYGKKQAIEDITGSLLDIQNNIWIVTHKQGLIKYNTTTKNGEKIIFDPSYPNTGVICITLDHMNRVWISTNNGVYIIDAITQKLLSHLTTKNSFLGQMVTPPLLLYCDNDGDIWLAAWQAGLVHIPYKQQLSTSPVNFKPEFYYNDPSNPNSITNNNIIRVYQAHDGSVYVSGSYFIQTFDKKTKQFNLLEWFDGANMVDDDNGNLWIASNSQGVSVYNPQQKKVKILGYDDPGKTYGINAFCDNDRIWILRKKEFIKINNNFDEVSHYKYDVGLKKLNNNTNALLLAKNKFFVGGKEGCYTIQLIDSEPTISPTVRPSRVLIYNKEIGVEDTIGERVLLPKTIDRINQITIPSGIKSFAIELSSIDFVDPDEAVFVYKLDGFDTTWNYLEYPHRLAVFNNLKGGYYVMHMAIYDPFTNWKEHTRTLKIEVVTPFYATTWFIALSVLLLIIIIVIVFTLRQYRLNKLNLKLENLVNQRTEELLKSNKDLQNQTMKLNKMNVDLIEKQNFINEQHEEIIKQRNKLQKNNDQLTDLNATKDKFFSIIAHDLKNPLGSIMGSLEILSEGFSVFEKEQIMEMIKEASGSSHIVYKLVENLLYWAQSVTGKMEFKKVDINVANLINSNHKIAGYTSRPKNITLNVDKIDDSLVIKADEDMLHFIFRNLLSNAIKFTPVDGKIQLKTTKYSNGVLFEITDNGVGLTKEKIADLFQIAKQVSTYGTNNEKGTGLGLILCKDFVEKHGGTIWVESEPGKGSSFFFSIPIS